jgi:transcription elongation factor GreA
MAKYLTKEGLDNLKKELERLETIERREVAEKLKLAISFGDISENAAYDDAKEALGFLEGKILELKETICSAKIIEKNGAKGVQIGSLVSLVCEGKKVEFQIVGPEEADVFKGKISYESPLGKLMLGKEKGAKVVLKTPGGQVNYEITGIK